MLTMNDTAGICSGRTRPNRQSSEGKQKKGCRPFFCVLLSTLQGPHAILGYTARACSVHKNISVEGTAAAHRRLVPVDEEALPVHVARPGAGQLRGGLLGLQEGALVQRHLAAPPLPPPGLVIREVQLQAGSRPSGCVVEVLLCLKSVSLLESQDVKGAASDHNGMHPSAVAFWKRSAFQDLCLL